MATWEKGLIITAIYTVGILAFTAALVLIVSWQHHPPWPKRIHRWDFISSEGARRLHEAKSHEAMERIVRPEDWPDK